MAKLRLSVCGAIALAACLPVTAAKSATVTQSFNFSASSFPSGSPINGWTGSFTITWNPTGGFQSGVLGAFSSNLPAGYGTFTGFYAGSGSGVVLGDNCTTSDCEVIPNNDQAKLEFLPAGVSGGLEFVFATVSSTSTDGDFTSFTGTVTQTPLPAALPLFATGLGGLGLLGWRRKRKARVVP
jgi:hypothetical protein